MSSDEKLSADQVFDIADAMQAAAAATLVLRRSMKDSLSDVEYEALVEKETALRYDADRYRAVGITLLASNGAITVQNLVDAIDDATKVINKINNIAQILNILSGLIMLGVTIAGGNVQAILTQVATLQTTVKANT
jgi:predicted MarR family transcription regulator